MILQTLLTIKSLILTTELRFTHTVRFYDRYAALHHGVILPFFIYIFLPPLAYVQAILTPLLCDLKSHKNAGSA